MPFLLIFLPQRKLKEGVQKCTKLSILPFRAVDDLVWGWAMILLLLGTHHFHDHSDKRNPRERFLKGLKLSVTKDPEA